MISQVIFANTLNDSIALINELNSEEIFVLVDSNTAIFCYPLLAPYLPSHHLIEISAGEENKNLESVASVWKILTANKAGRKSILINLGGGTITDLGGFAAGCYKRGIRFINIPTSLLGMVDAGIGSKTGFDFEGYKNQIGLFCEPEFILISSDFLKTLPDREFRSGMAEIVKHYMIADQEHFFKLSEEHFRYADDSILDLLKRSIAIKSSIVSQDPYETGIRKALNFGHTIGHAVESWFLSNVSPALLHGEAVAVGIVAESYVSYRRNMITKAELESISHLIIKSYQLPLLKQESYMELIQLMLQDKKNENTDFRFTLLHGIGNYSVNEKVNEQEILDGLNYYNSILP